VKDWFAGCHHGSEGLAFLEFDALLVDRELDDGRQIREHLARVLQSDRDVVRAGYVGEVAYERHGVVLGQTKAVVIVLEAGSALQRWS